MPSKLAKKLNNLSLYWVYIAMIFVVQSIPLVIYLLTRNIPITLVFFVIITFSLAAILFKFPEQNVRRLNHLIEDIETNIRLHNSMPGNFAQLKPLFKIRELRQLSDNFERVLEMLQRQIAELNSLYAISQTITSSTLDYEKTVKAVLAAVQKVVDYDAAEIAILNPTDNHLHVEAWWGKEGFKDTTGRKYKVGAGPTGSIASTKEALFLPTLDLANTEGFQRTIGYATLESELLAKTTKLEINSLLGIPLIVGNRLIGTLTLVHHQRDFFDLDDKRQLTKLSDQASIAVDNALKIREREARLQRQIAELKVAIDEDKRKTAVSEITDTDYFQQLQINAALMRGRSQQKDQNDKS